MSKLIKERGGKHDQIFKLKEPSFVIIAYLEIEVACTPCWKCELRPFYKTIDTLYL